MYTQLLWLFLEDSISHLLPYPIHFFSHHFNQFKVYNSSALVCCPTITTILILEQSYHNKKKPMLSSHSLLSHVPRPPMTITNLLSDSWIQNISLRWNHMICFLLCSRIIYIVLCSSASFLFMGELYSIVWTYNILSIHLSDDGILGSSHLLTIMNNDAMNIYMHVFA